MKSFLWFQNSMDQAVSLNKYFITYRTTAESYVVCRNNAKVVKLKVHVFQLLNPDWMYKSHSIMSLLRDMKLARQKCWLCLIGVLSCRFMVTSRQLKESNYWSIVNIINELQNTMIPCFLCVFLSERGDHKLQQGIWDFFTEFRVYGACMNCKYTGKKQQQN